MVFPALVACSTIAPGMHFDSSSVTADQSTQEMVADKKPIMKAITPTLVKYEREQRDRETLQDISQLVKGPTPYSIQGGDVLAITVWDHPELGGNSMAPVQGIVGTDNNASATSAAGFVVDHDGVIQYPYAGSLKVAGMTEGQAKTALASKLGRYINKPDVTLRVQSYRSKRVYLDGEIKQPGLQPINDVPMTLMEAVNRSGGFLPTADQSQVAVTREGKTYNVNLVQLMQRGVNPSSIMLANGDVVRVLSREESKVFVSGEVMQPKALIMHNGRMTLNEALGEAGGLNPQTADGRQVYVVRNAAGKEPLVYHLDTRSPAGLSLAEEFDLKPKDVVYVDAAPLATWHRVISLILPSALSQAASVGTTVR